MYTCGMWSYRNSSVNAISQNSIMVMHHCIYLYVIMLLGAIQGSIHYPHLHLNTKNPNIKIKEKYSEIFEQEFTKEKSRYIAKRFGHKFIILIYVQEWTDKLHYMLLQLPSYMLISSFLPSSQSKNRHFLSRR